MFNATNMNSIKYYTTSANKSATFAIVYIMNVCQKCPELYNFVVKNTHNKTVDIIIGALCWMFLLGILQSLLRTCMDPFSVKLHTKIIELENKLSDEEDLYNILFDEKNEQDEKIIELEKKLKDAERALIDLKAQYLCCRAAAQTFIDRSASLDAST
jgi:hypothetical protein